MKNRKICEKCRRVFAFSSADQDRCQECSDGLTPRAKNEYYKTHYKNNERICKKCNKFFYSYPKDKRVRCYECIDKCNLNVKKYGEGKALNEKNYLEQFLKEKKEITRKISYDKLNRQMEWKRVFGKGAWDRYLQGKKWDEI